MVKQRNGIDRSLLERIHNRLILCERDDGERRLVAYLATSKDRTFIGFESWPDGEGYTSCTFVPSPLRRASDASGVKRYRVGQWVLRQVRLMSDEDYGPMTAGTDVAMYEAKHKVDFDANMDIAEELLAGHRFGPE